MAAVQVLQDSPATLEARFYADGVLADDPGTVTVTIIRADGTTLISAAATTKGGTGIYRYALARQPELNLLKVVWTGQAQTQTTWAEIVGEHLFSLASAKAFDGGAIPASGVTDTEILEGRARIGDDFQEVCGVSFFPRYAREVLDGTGRGELQLANHRVLRLLSVNVAGVAQSLAGFTLDPALGIVRRTSAYTYTGSFAAGAGNVIVEYVHGHPQVPGPVSRAALILARVQLVPSNVGDRATSISSDQGVISLATAGRGQFQPFGIPLVDSVLARYDERVPAVG